MTIYIDDSVRPYRGIDYCHMMTDYNLDELHGFAGRLGLTWDYFTNNMASPHYDVPHDKYDKAIELGAVQVEQLELLEKCAPRLALILNKQAFSPERFLSKEELSELKEEAKRRGI